MQKPQQSKSTQGDWVKINSEKRPQVRPVQHQCTHELSLLSSGSVNMVSVIQRSYDGKMEEHGRKEAARKPQVDKDLGTHACKACKPNLFLRRNKD